MTNTATKWQIKPKHALILKYIVCDALLWHQPCIRVFYILFLKSILYIYQVKIWISHKVCLFSKTISITETMCWCWTHEMNWYQMALMDYFSSQFQTKLHSAKQISIGPMTSSSDCGLCHAFWLNVLNQTAVASLSTVQECTSYTLWIFFELCEII